MLAVQGIPNYRQMCNEVLIRNTAMPRITQAIENNDINALLVFVGLIEVLID